MCGIAGIFSYGAPWPQVDADELECLGQALFRRGPDGAGTWVSPDGRIGFTHRRLAIIDLSDGGAQPMASLDGRFEITFNGEIYNYVELKADLVAKGHAFRSTSDTEVLLNLYREYGPGMVPMLRGMFAFAIWDGRERTLFMARDPFGIKPLYLADDGRTLRFASQVKALATVRGMGLEINDAGLAGFLLLGHVPEPFTLFKNIRPLGAGQTLTLKEGGRIEEGTHFHLPTELAQAEEAGRSMNLSGERVQLRVREAVLDSIRAHFVSDVPVGLFLSAGVDSSSLVALASEVSSGQLKTITLGFKEYQGTRDDETIMAERTARLFGTQHETRMVDRNYFREALPQALEAMDQPTIDGLNTYLVCKVAAEAGLKVALSGLGGDELFGGYPSFQQIPRMVKGLSWVKTMPAVGRIFRNALRPFAGTRFSPKWASMLEYGHSLAGAYLLRHALFMPWEFDQLLLDIPWKRAMEELHYMDSIELDAKALTTARGSVTCLEMGQYMKNQLLRDSDWASMAHSLELRTPLTDSTLFRAVAPLRFCSSPASKRTLVNAPKIPLPDEVRIRKKTGFSMPIQTWMPMPLPAYGIERGLRGWGRFVLDTYGSQFSPRRSPGLLGRPTPDPSVKKVLIYRIGSLGDTIVALPCFHLIAKAFPEAQRIVLTNQPEHVKAPSLAAVLTGSGLVDGFYPYPLRIPWLRKLWILRAVVREIRPEVLIYLAPTRLLSRTIRDWIFFRLCGISNIVGLPFAPSLRINRPQPNSSLVESEASRLARCLHALGKVDLEDSRNWDLQLTAEEKFVAGAVLATLPPGSPWLVFCVGTKIPVKEWGEHNWASLMQKLATTHGDMPIVAVGSREDKDVTGKVLSHWPGPVLNLCGELTPREVGAVLRKAKAYLGLDSGPMHLAAAMGVPVVAVFSARATPGTWFPFGDNHRPIYHKVPCFDCQRTECEDRKKICISSITVNEVHEAITAVLASSAP